MLTCLIVLTILLFLLTLLGILQTNGELFHLPTTRLFSIKIIDTSTAASLFVTLIGALLVRHQFVIGVLPRINYTSKTAERATKQNLNELLETWRVEIRNTGLGSAIINRLEYTIEPANGKVHLNHCTFEQALNQLAEIGLIREHDFWIGNMSSGFSLSPKDEFFVFEIELKHITKLKRLDLILDFQGQLGDRYRREINLIPVFSGKGI